MVKSAGSPFDVKVGWASERHVQVGVEGDSGRSLFWLLYGDKLAQLGSDLSRFFAVPVDAVSTEAEKEALAERGRGVLNVLDCLSDFGERGYAGVWADLDRAGINRLIRILRKARDAAFGADA